MSWTSRAAASISLLACAALALAEDEKGPPGAPGGFARARAARVRAVFGAFPIAREGAAAVAFSPDGTLACVAARRGELAQLSWCSLSSPEPVSLAEAKGRPLCLAFAPDGKKVALGSPGEALLFSPGALVGRTKLGQADPGAVELTPDGARLVALSRDGKLRVLDLATGTTALEVPAHPASDDEEAPLPLALSQDGAKALTGGADGSAALHELATGKTLWRFPGGEGVQLRGAALSPDGKLALLLVAADVPVKDDTVSVTKLLVLDAETGRDQKQVEVARGARAIALGRTGVVLSQSDDGRLLAVDALAGAAPKTLGRPGEAASAAVSPDGKLALVAVRDRTWVPLYDLAAGRQARGGLGHEDAAVALAFARDAKRVYSGGADGTVRAWDAASAKLLATYACPRATPAALAASADGRRVVAVCPPHADGASCGACEKCSADGRLVEQLFVLDEGRDRLVAVEGSEGKDESFTAVALSPDGRLAALAGRKGVALWDVEERKRVRSLEVFLRDPSTPPALAFSPDGKLVLGSEGSWLELWDAASGAAVRRIETKHHGGVLALSFSPDGKRLASASARGEVELRSAETGELARSFEVGASFVEVVFSPDLTTLLGREGKGAAVRVIDLEKARELDLVTGTEARAVAFGADARTFFVGSELGVLLRLERAP